MQTLCAHGVHLIECLMQIYFKEFTLIWAHAATWRIMFGLLLQLTIC